MARARTTEPHTAGGTAVTLLIAAAAVALIVLPVVPAGAQQPERPAAPQQPVEAPAAAGQEAVPEEAELATEEAAPEEPATAAQPAPTVRVVTILREDEVATRIAETYGVDVVRVKRNDLASGPAYAVSVMAPPGAGPVPFQVTTLLVDAASGELIPQFRHGASGHQRSASFSAVAPGDTDSTVLRLKTFRPRPESAR